MSIQTEEGRIEAREEEVINRVAILGATGPVIPRISEGALLAVSQSRTNDPHKTNMQVEEVVPQIGITRTREISA